MRGIVTITLIAGTTHIEGGMGRHEAETREPGTIESAGIVAHTMGEVVGVNIVHITIDRIDVGGEGLDQLCNDVGRGEEVVTVEYAHDVA